MKVFRIIGRSFKSACKSLVRNFSLTMASITCTIITLVLVAVGLLVSYNVNEITSNIEREMTIVIFMDPSVSTDILTQTKLNIEKVDNIESVVLKTKEDIKNDMASDEKWSDIVGTLNDDENPFQDSFEIVVKDVRDINETVTTIKNMEHIESIKYGENSVNELIDIFDGVKTGTIILVVGLVLVTAFLINNTIKITIFSRKREIDIMRLVGTSNIVIKMPYLMEGFLIGVIGSILPILVTIFGYTVLFDKVSNIGSNGIIGIIKLAEPNGIIYTAALFLLILGSVVGMIASIRAVRKHLTV